MNNEKAAAKDLDQNGKPYHKIILILLLLIGTFFTVLNQSTLATAYPDMMNYFNVNSSTIQWLTSGYLMINGIMIPLSAWFSQRFNTKWIYLATLLVFEAGSIIAYYSSNFGMILTGRIVQAISAGISMPLLQTIMMTIFPPERRGSAMGLSGLVIGLGPAIGPSLSGWIVDNANWRDLFGMNIIPLAIVFVLSIFYMHPVLPTKKSSVDSISVILSILGFGTLLYGFSTVGNNGWSSPVVIFSLIIGIILVGFFVWRELSTDNPLVDLRVFKYPRFSVGTILASLAMMGLVGFEMILPLYLQTVRGDNALHSGLTLLAGALMIGVMSPITGRILDKYGAKFLAVSGFLLLSMGSLPFLFLTKNTPELYITVIYAVRSLGIAMSMMTITTYSMNALPNEKINHGTAANNTLRQVASAIATAILTSVLSNVQSNAKPVHGLSNTNPLLYADKMIVSVLKGYHAAFGVSLAFCLLGFIIALFIKNNTEDLKSSKEADRK